MFKHAPRGLDAQLIKAVDDGDEEKARFLVKRGASIKAVGGEALISASETEALYPDRKDHPISLLKFLIEGGADVNYSGGLGYTPLMWSAFTGSSDAARLLIQHGAKVNSHDRDGNTALMIAARVPGWEDGDMCFPKVARVLVANGAHLNETNVDGDTALLIVAKIETLDIAGYPEEADQASGDLGDATAYAECLIKAGAKVSIANKDGKTALLAACNASRSCNSGLAELLLEHGADANQTDTDEETPLMLVAQTDHSPSDDPSKVDEQAVDLAESLLKHGADVNAKHPSGFTALMSACNSEGFAGPFCKRHLAHLLISHGARVNDVNNEGESALMCLAGVTNDDPINSADVAIAEDLLKHGANPALKNKSGLTALDIARKNKLKRLVKVLETAK